MESSNFYKSGKICQSSKKDMGELSDKGKFSTKEYSSLKRMGSKTQSPLDDSQNFVLRLSDTIPEDKTQFCYFKESNEKRLLDLNKVIIISDSSESSSPEKFEKRRWNSDFPSYGDKNKRRSDSIMIEESSSSDESDSDTGEKQSEAIQKKTDMFKTIRKIGISYTSDETICSTKSDKSSSNSSHVSPTPRSPSLFANREPKTSFFTDVNPTTHNLVPRKYMNHKGKEVSRNITRAKRPVYFTDMKKATESTDSRADGSSEEQENRKIGKTTTVIINETLSDDFSHVSGTQQSSSKSTYADRFPKSTDQESARIHVTLSERKRKEIANWIMANSPDSRSSSSCSNVSDTNKGASSGNSSLERFEMKHETPNNRGKFPKSSDGKDTVTFDRPTKTYQTNVDRFLEKSKMELKLNDFQTPKQKKLENATTSDPKSSIKTGSDNLGIMDCADVLDNLYGNAWRENADVLLQRSEPRKPQVSRIDRAVQTEKKKILKSKFQSNVPSDSESEDDNFDIFLKNVKTHQEKTKKSTKTSKKLGSFIDDRSSSEISGDSIYHTAVSLQRPSDESVPIQKPKPILDNVKNALAICDPDTDEDDTKKINKNKNINRRRLLFSDESNDSSTSEFDPEDQVLPRPMPKKDFSKVPHYTPKTSTKSKTASFDIRGTKSFLASLSTTVPISETHSEAKTYKTNFKDTKEELSKRLYKLYNEKIFEGKLPTEVPIEWNVRMRGTAGFCYNKRSIKSSGGIVRSSRIQLATKIIDTPERLRDTLVHEMCHAAAWLINEVSDGHGPFWKSWVNKAMKAFPELPPIKRCHDYKISTKYTYRCTSCGYSIGRHSKSLDTEKKRCGYCYGKFEVLINKTTKSGTVQTKTPSRSKEPSGFALYVKENYHSVKQNRRSMKHGEVMKILGQQFSAIKIAKKHDNVEQNNPGSPDL